MKKALLALAVAGAAVSVHADTTVSGQVNSAVLFGGDVDDATTVDNNTTGTRFRIKSSKEVGSVKYGARLEYQFQDNQSSSLEDTLSDASSQDAATVAANGTTTTSDSEVRYSDVWISGKAGKLGIGKGDGAANGTFEAFGLLNFLGGSESHLLWQGATALAYRDIDGISRQNRVRYDSPKLGGGFRIALSLDNGDAQELAVKYKGKILGGTVDARYGMVDRDAGADSDDVKSYSVAYKHNSGFGVSFSDAEDDNAAAATLEADWIQVAYDFGNVIVSYGTGESGAANTVTDEFDTVSIVYKPVKGVEVYLNFADFENATGVSGDATAIGSRFKF
jgi:hypothetical protein